MIKNFIKTIDDKPSEYGKDFMKVNFNSDDNLPLNKLLKFRMLTIIVRSVFQEDSKYCPQFFEMNVCMSYKNAIIRKN